TTSCSGPTTRRGVRPARRSRTASTGSPCTCQPRRHALGGVAGAAREAAGIQAADGVDVSLGVLVRRRLQLRLQRWIHRGATAREGHRIQLPPRGALAGRQRGAVVFAAMTGTDAATYARERPGVRAFAL